MKIRALATLVLVGWMSTFFLTPFTSAAPLSSQEDRLSRQEAGVAADHLIRFTSTSALLTPGQTIQIVFPGLFDVSSLVLGDLRFSYGATTGEELVAPLAAVPGGGVWGAVFSGNTLTLEVPTDAGVSGIQAGDRVILRIGFNAGGSSQIVNPGVPNLYRLAITTSVDTGYLFVPIVSAASLTVTATVPTPPAGPGPEPTGTTTHGTIDGPGTDGTPGDTRQPLTMSGPAVSDITSDEAVVTWTTNFSANTTVEYGETEFLGGTVYGATGVTAHRVVLAGLRPNTTYYLQLRSQETGRSVSTRLTFRTLAVGQVPVVSSLWIESVSDQRATAVFTTDIPARATLTVRKFGDIVGGSSQQTYLESGFTTAHRIDMTGLVANTRYLVSITAQAMSGGVSAALETTFTTTDDRTPPPNPSDFNATGLARAIRLEWNAVLASGESVIIVARTDRVPLSATDGRVVYTGTARTTLDSGLQPSTRYFYTLFAVDARGNASSGATATAQTLTETAPPDDSTTCTAGFHLEGTSCVRDTDEPIIIPPPDDSLTCTPGFHVEGTRCVRNTDDTVAPLDDQRTCEVGFHVEGTRCVRNTDGTVPPPDDQTACGAGFHLESTGCVRNTDDGITPPPGEETCGVGFHTEGTRCVRDADATTCNQPGYHIEAGRCVSDTDGTVLIPPPDESTTCVPGFHRERTAAGDVCVRDTDQATTSTIIIPPDGEPTCDRPGFHIEHTTTGDVCVRDSDRTTSSTIIIPPDDQLSCQAGFHLETNAQGSICVNDRDGTTTLPIRIPATGDLPTSTRILPPLPELFPIGTSTSSRVALTVGQSLFEENVENQLSPTEPEPLPEARAHVYVANGALELLARQGVRTTLVGQTLLFRIPLAGQTRVPVAGQLQLNGSTFLLTERDGALETAVTAPAMASELRYAIRFVYTDETRSQETGVIRLRPLATIREGQLIQRDRGALLSGATIEVLLNGVLWSATPFQEVNPVITSDAGLYGFVLANGRYHLRVRKEGYRPWEQDVDVSDQVLATSLTLTKELTSLSALLSQKGTPVEKIAALGAQANIAAQIVRDVSQSPAVQAATQNVVAPAAVIATVGATATAVSSVSALNYVRFLFTQPFLLIRRRRRNKWGVVYNAFTKKPIDLAIVRLLQATSGVVVQTRITDAQGRFSFQVLPGEYRLQFLKAGFTYPSIVLGGSKEDGDFLDLYHGEVITAKEGALLTPNIPVDPAVREETPAKILWRDRLRRLQNAVSIGGVVVTIVALIIAPSVLMGGFAVLQIATYFIFRRLAMPPRPTDWGIAYDEATKKPLGKTVVRIFDKKFNKLLETQITDEKGKYGFFTAKGLYYVTAEKGGYDKYVSTDIDLRTAKETVIDQRIGLSATKR